MPRLAIAAKRLIPLIPLILGGAVVWGLMQSPEGTRRAKIREIAVPVRIVSAVAAPVVPVAHGFGLTRPGRVWLAVAEVSGNVVAVPESFREGVLVEKDSVLIRLDPTRYQLAVDELEAEVLEIDAKKKELDATETNYRASLVVEQSSLALTKKESERGRQMLERNAISPSELDQLKREELKQATAVTNLENQLRLLPSQRASVEAQAKSFRNKLARARLDLKRTVIQVPFSARLSEVNVQIGQFVPAGTTMAAADSIDVTEVVAQLQMSHMRRVIPDMVQADIELPLTGAAEKLLAQALGASVRLRDGEFEAHWKARFLGIGDSIDAQTRTISVIAAVDDPYAKARLPEQSPLVKGMYVQLRLEGRKTAETIVVPIEALRSDEVLIADAQDRLRRQAVDVRFTQGGICVLLAGVAAGDRVIISDPVPAIDGMLLRCQDDDEARQRVLEELAR